MFNSSNNGFSLSDIAAVTRDSESFGGNGWWILIILLALFGGFGNWGGAYGGNAGRYGGSGGVTDGYVLASDFSNIERKIDTVNNGLCDGFYAMNTGMLNGFAGVNSAIANLGYQAAQNTNAITGAITSGTYALSNGINSVAAQVQDCCCQNKSAFADVKYTMATDTCAITNAINQASQNIINNDNANYRALHDENVASKLEAKDAIIAELRSQINTHAIDDSNRAQSMYLLGQLNPPAIPAYQVPNPYTGTYGYRQTQCPCQQTCC